MSTLVTINRTATVLLTVSDEQQFLASHLAWQGKEGAFLPAEQRADPQTYLSGIAVQVERGERPEVAGLLYRVELQEVGVSF